MNVVYDAAFLEKLKKVDVRIRKKIKERILLFSKNPIDITSDYRAIYKETPIGDGIVAYFMAIGTHEELYGKSTGKN